MAAVLACGEGAVLSHRSAAELWSILRVRRPSGAGARALPDPVDVTVPGDSGRAKRAGVRLHRSLTLSPADCALHEGIPVTKPARTLEDLRRVLSAKQFAAALREAEFLGLPTGEIATDHTRSELEARFLALCRRHRIPQPVVNVRIDRFFVDFLWPFERLIVEVDGWRAHRGRSAFEADRARDTRLKLHGYEVLRFTWRQIESDRTGVIETVRQLLRR